MKNQLKVPSLKRFIEGLRRGEKLLLTMDKYPERFEVLPSSSLVVRKTSKSRPPPGSIYVTGKLYLVKLNRKQRAELEKGVSSTKILREIAANGSKK